jgi:hypothetical protein
MTRESFRIRLFHQSQPITDNVNHQEPKQVSGAKWSRSTQSQEHLLIIIMGLMGATGGGATGATGGGAFGPQHLSEAP